MQSRTDSAVQNTLVTNSSNYIQFVLKHTIFIHELLQLSNIERIYNIIHVQVRYYSLRYAQAHKN